MTLTALKIIAYLCNYLHVPDHGLRPVKWVQEHAHRPFIFLIFFFQVWFRFAAWKPPSCRSHLAINPRVRLSSCECKPKAAHVCPRWVWFQPCWCPCCYMTVRKQVKPSSWRQERHIYFILKCNLWISWATRGFRVLKQAEKGGHLTFSLETRPPSLEVLLASVEPDLTKLAANHIP